MSIQVALYVYLLFIAWLLYQDTRNRQGISKALWLVVFWLAILASRPVSAWLSLGVQIELIGNEAEGNTLDRNVFLLLILAALVVLKKRNLKWSAVISRNRPLFLLYLFFAISIAWSEDPFVAFKRWFKDFGNVVMVLVILTEKEPLEAVRAVFVRCGYVLIPLSVLFIKYYTWLGKEYSRSTGETHYQGVALGKNLLGAAILVLTLFLLWDLIQKFRQRNRNASLKRNIGPLLVFVMAIYVLRIANSATAIACVVLGSVGLFVLMLPTVRKRLKNLSALTIIGALLLLLLSSVFDLKGQVAAMLGRDPTLTGRDVIWKTVLAEKSNPLIGTGFNSFWLGNRSERLSQKNKYIFRLNQAHNGYLELYLNGGSIGVCLLLATLIITGRRIRQQLLVDPDWSSIRLVFWLIVVIYNWSEAAFFRLSPVWFVLLVVMLELPRRTKVTSSNRSVADNISPEPRGTIPSTCASTV